jgi:hypothetical protein
VGRLRGRARRAEPAGSSHSVDAKTGYFMALIPSFVFWAGVRCTWRHQTAGVPALGGAGSGASWTWRRNHRTTT